MVQTYNASRDLSDDSTLTDALQFFKKKSFQEINTIILAQIIEVDDATHRLSVRSLINGIDTNNAPIIPPTIYDVPFGTIRGGNAGIITKYVVGDNVIIGFCQRQIDITKETQSQSTPNLLRSFSFQDAVVLAHWSNSLPSIYLKITDDEIEIQSTNKPITITTTGDTTINATNINLNGNITVTGKLTVGNTVLSSSLPAVIDSHPFLLHTHNGVQTGGSNSGPVT